jgi:ferrochelatase
MAAEWANPQIANLLSEQALAVNPQMVVAPAHHHHHDHHHDHHH